MSDTVDGLLVLAVDSVKSAGYKLSPPAALMVDAASAAINNVAPALLQQATTEISQTIGSVMNAADVVEAVPIIGWVVKIVAGVVTEIIAVYAKENADECHWAIMAYPSDTHGAGNSVSPTDFFNKTGNADEMDAFQQTTDGPGGTMFVSDDARVPAIGRALITIFETDDDPGRFTDLVDTWSPQTWTDTLASLDSDPLDDQEAPGGSLAQDGAGPRWLAANAIGATFDQGGLDSKGVALPKWGRVILERQWNSISGEHITTTPKKLRVATQALRRAIQAQYGVPGSDGGLSLWPALCDAYQASIDGGHMSQGFAGFLINNRIDWNPLRTTHCSCDWEPVVDGIWKMLHGWHNTVHPTLAKDQAALASIVSNSAVLVSRCKNAGKMIHLKFGGDQGALIRSILANPGLTPAARKFWQAKLAALPSPLEQALKTGWTPALGALLTPAANMGILWPQYKARIAREAHAAAMAKIHLSSATLATLAKNLKV